MLNDFLKVLKELHDLSIKKNWLKEIDKAVDKYNRANAKAKREAHIVHALVKKYNSLYPDDKIKTNTEEGQASL